MLLLYVGLPCRRRLEVPDEATFKHKRCNQAYYTLVLRATE